MAKKVKGDNRYAVLIERIFFDNWKRGATQFEFERIDFELLCAKLEIALPKNLGDVIYSFRSRVPLPEKILNTQPKGMEWIIEGAGRSRYRFRLAKETRIIPNKSLLAITIADSTPELIRKYELDDEQALLAIVRYNRLIDIFLGLTTYSLQNHLRTTVSSIGQIEIDELYVGLDKNGSHYVIPVQAKGGKDQISIVQISQDLGFAAEKFPGTRCKPIAVQFMSGGVVALFQLTLQDGEVKVVEEKHYQLVPAKELDPEIVHGYQP